MINFNSSSFENQEYITPEQSLWRAVILQAFIDLQSNSKKQLLRTFKIQSLLWFNLQNRDFINACHCAGFDPLYVWRRAEKIKETVRRRPKNYASSNSQKTLASVRAS